MTRHAAQTRPARNRIFTRSASSAARVFFQDLADEQISAALRSHLGLLTPAEIRRALRTLGMQQKTLAACLGIAEATLSRWLSGGLIQSRAMDNLLRVYFGIPAVREVLIGSKKITDFGARGTGVRS